MKYWPSTLVGKVTSAVLLIVFLSMVALAAASWLASRVNTAPEALNVAGSLRMQTYEVGLLSVIPEDQLRLQGAIDFLNRTWRHPALISHSNSNESLQAVYKSAREQWQNIEQSISFHGTQAGYYELNSLVREIDSMVALIQADTEQRIGVLRNTLFIAVLIMMISALTISYWLYRHFHRPMQQLTNTARHLACGDFTAQSGLTLNNELGTLSRTMDKMTHTISSMYGQLEKQVEQKTSELKRSNQTLNFLYELSNKVSKRALEYDDFNDTVERVCQLIDFEDIELCLLTEQGEVPYLQFKPETAEKDFCSASNCEECISASECSSVQDQERLYKYPLSRDGKYYGILIARLPQHERLEEWKQDVLRSTVELLALALSLKNDEDQVRRLALMSERAVIARELHDSLAQALSYLKIQVTRLKKAKERNDEQLFDDVTTELEKGLNSAYRELRELLTTFRLRIDGQGLLEALQTTVKQLTAQSDLKIALDYRLKNLPLEPQEEIHVLQIIREAAQNAVHHSKGKSLKIGLKRAPGGEIQISVEDDGVGLPENTEKLNHYGLAIIQERGRSLNGEVSVKNRPEGGVGVYATFQPTLMH